MLEGTFLFGVRALLIVGRFAHLVVVVASREYGGLNSGDGGHTSVTFPRMSGSKHYVPDSNMPSDLTWSRGSGHILNTAGIQTAVGRFFMSGSDTSPGPTTPGTSLEEVCTIAGIAVNEFFGVEHAKVNMEMVNLTNVPMKVRIYFMSCRGEAPLVSSIYSPIHYWQEYNNEYDTGVEYPITVIGNTPYKAPGFGRAWHIIKDVHFELSAGGRHSVSMFKPIMQMVSQAQFGAGVEGADMHQFIRNLTFGFMIVASGMTSCDETGGTLMDTTGGLLGFTWDFECLSGPGYEESTVTRRLLTNTYDPPAGNADATTTDETGVNVLVATA